MNNRRVRNLLGFSQTRKLHLGNIFSFKIAVRYYFTSDMWLCIVTAPLTLCVCIGGVIGSPRFPFSTAACKVIRSCISPCWAKALYRQEYGALTCITIKGFHYILIYCKQGEILFRLVFHVLTLSICTYFFLSQLMMFSRVRLKWLKTVYHTTV